MSSAIPLDECDPRDVERTIDLLKRSVDLSEARVWTRQALVNFLRAEHDENNALARRWEVAMKEAWQSLDDRIRLFKVALTAIGELGLAPEILERLHAIDAAAAAADRAAGDCGKAAGVDGALLFRSSERFESCRVRHETLLASFRRKYFPSAAQFLDG